MPETSVAARLLEMDAKNNSGLTQEMPTLMWSAQVAALASGCGKHDPRDPDSFPGD